MELELARGAALGDRVGACRPRATATDAPDRGVGDTSISIAARCSPSCDDALAQRRRGRGQLSLLPRVPTLNDGFSAPQQLDALGVVDARRAAGRRTPRTRRGARASCRRRRRHWSRSVAQSRRARRATPSTSSAGSGRAAPIAVEQVPVVVEHLGDRAQMLELHAGREHDEHRRLELGVVEQLVDEARASAPRTRAATTISSRTSIRGGSPASIGNSVRMRCANACSVQIAASSSSSSAARTARARRSSTSSACRLELAPHAVAQLGRRLLGERDRRDRAHRHGRPAIGVTSATIRSTSAVVLPVPAPASTNSVSSSSVRIAIHARRRG